MAYTETIINRDRRTKVCEITPNPPPGYAIRVFELTGNLKLWWEMCGSTQLAVINGNGPPGMQARDQVAIAEADTVTELNQILAELKRSKKLPKNLGYMWVKAS